MIAPNLIDLTYHREKSGLWLSTKDLFSLSGCQTKWSKGLLFSTAKQIW